MIKGKMVLDDPARHAAVTTNVKHGSGCEVVRPQKKWEAQPVGWHKLNIDGAFSQAAGNGRIGMYLRDNRGSIVFTSSQHLFTCNDALTAELDACRDGISLALEWSTLPLIVETNNLSAGKWH